jgi:two-component system, sensor histidine kinase and response regulator
MVTRNHSASLSASTATSVPNGAEVPILDRDAMLATVEQDLELLQELAELFLAEAPGLLAQIRSGVGEHNAESVERGAHTLKGALGNFGARRACEAAREVETCGREGRLEDAAAHFSSLEGEVALACKALSDYLREVKDEGSGR